MSTTPHLCLQHKFHVFVALHAVNHGQTVKGGTQVRWDELAQLCFVGGHYADFLAAAAERDTAVAAATSMHESAFLWATFKNIIRALGMPVFFQSLTLGIRTPNIRDTSAVPPRESIIWVAALFMARLSGKTNLSVNSS